MAEKKTNDRVKFKIPRFAGVAEDDVQIGINGVNYIIPRGVTVEVPQCVVDEYYRSEEAKEIYYSTQAAKLAAAKSPEVTSDDAD